MDKYDGIFDEQDPDYTVVGPSDNIYRQKVFEETARTNASRKINQIIEKEFTKEINSKESEISLIQSRLNQALRTLHLLRYVIITDFYNRKQCIAPTQSDYNPANQTRIHPAIKRVNNHPLNFLFAPSSSGSCHPVTAETSNTCQQDNSRILLHDPKNIKKIDDRSKENAQSSNCNHDEKNVRKRCTETGEDNSNEPLKKIPRHIPPKLSDPVVQNPSRGDRHKVIKRIIVGNISKWIPPEWRNDNASHKWTIYVRGAKEETQISSFVSKIRFFLHPSYRPNDVVEVSSPPFHLSRRGWGEFPLRVQLHFKNSFNKPMDIIHNLKLDRTYTGLQTLGSETIIDLWIRTHNVPDSSQNDTTNQANQAEIHCEPETIVPDNNITIEENPSTHDDTKLSLNYNDALRDHDYISFNTVDVKNIANDITINHENKFSETSKSINNAKELTPLEIIIPPRFATLQPQNIQSKINLPQKLQLTSNTIQNEIYIGNGSRLPKVKLNPTRSLLLEPNNYVPTLQIARPHTIEDREVKPARTKVTIGKDKMKITNKRESYENMLKAIDDVRIFDIVSLLRFIVKRVPMIDENASDPEYRRVHPYVSSSQEQFMNYNVGKQRALEWYRAKVIHSFLKKKVFFDERLWTIREIIVWCRFHGYTPPINLSNFASISAKNIRQSSKVSEYGNSDNIQNKLPPNTKTPPSILMNWKKKTEFMLNEVQQNDEAIDVVNFDNSIDAKSRRSKYGICNRDNDDDDDHDDSSLTIPIPKSIMPLHEFVCNTARLIGIRIAPKEFIPEIKHYVTVHLIVKSVQCLLENILRSSLASAQERSIGKMRYPDEITIEDVRNALQNRSEFDIFTNSGLMDTPFTCDNSNVDY